MCKCDKRLNALARDHRRLWRALWKIAYRDMSPKRARYTARRAILAKGY